MIKNVKRSKAEKIEYKGILFANEWERNYYRDVLEPASVLLPLDRIEIQPHVVLAESVKVFNKKMQAVKYVTDFSFLAPCGKEVHIDVKGHATETAKLKRRLFYSVHSDKLLFWVAYSKIDGGWIEYNRLQKVRRKRKKQKEAAKNEPKPIPEKKSTNNARNRHKRSDS